MATTIILFISFEQFTFITSFKPKRQIQSVLLAVFDSLRHECNTFCISFDDVITNVIEPI